LRGFAVFVAIFRVAVGIIAEAFRDSRDSQGLPELKDWPDLQDFRDLPVSLDPQDWPDSPGSASHQDSLDWLGSMALAGMPDPADCQVLRGLLGS
jgi:hypothetical protein